MPRGRDEAGNIWELDAQGNPVRMLQPATNSFPGSIPGAFVPPNPAMVAKQQREQAHEVAADARAERADQRAAQAEHRAQLKFESEDTMAPPPGDTSKTGEEYLATIPPTLAAQARAMIEGRRAFPTGAALRSPAIQQLVAAATQADPTLDATNSFTRVATRKKFTSGTTRDNITAINTALGHLGTLWQGAQKLNNFGSPIVNAPINAFESGVLGDPRYTNFNLTRHAVVDELEKAFRGSGGTQTGIEEWKQGINNSQSPEQLRGAVGKAVELLSSRLQALGDAYATGMGRSADPMEFLNPHAQAVFGALGPGGDGNVPPLPKDFGGAPPILGGSGTAPPPTAPQGPPAIGGGSSPSLPGGVPKVDYSAMVGADASLASGNPNDVLEQAYRKIPDNPAAATIAAFIRHGRPYETALAYARSHGFNPPSPQEYNAAVAYQKANPTSTPNVDALRNVPMSFGEKAASSPIAAGVAGGVSGGTAGFADLAGQLIGGDEYEANRHGLADLHPTANLIGNVIGGAGGAILAPQMLAKTVPGAMGLLAKAGAKLGRFAPATGDAAYGAVYGANESPGNRLLGATTGAVAGAGGGMLGRGATRGLANVIAPPAGAFGPAYAQRVFPTLGQRFSRSGFAGRALNTVEQAMQSFPGLGAMVARARDIPRDAAQLGAFNESLGELAPFDAALGRKVSGLPAGMQPGTEPHAFTAKAFGDAYDHARSGMQFVPDAPYQTDLTAFSNKITDGTLSGEQAKQVLQRINTAVNGRLSLTGGALDGEAYKAAGSDLGRTVDQWSRDPAKASMADALSDYQTIFDDAARRNSDPAAVSLLDAADRGYAKYARVRNASARVGGDPGTFTMKGLQRAVQQEGGGVSSGPFLRGSALMQPYSTAVQGLGDSLANSGTGERLLTNKMFLGEQAGSGALFGHSLGAAAMAHPGALAPFAPYLPGVNKLVTRAIAPRSATLAPDVASALDRIAAQINDRSTLGGRLALPAAVGWELQR